MKKMFLLATMIIGIISCGKSDDESVSNSQLHGTWRVVDGEVNGQRTSQMPMTYEDRQARECATRSTFKFLANGDFRGVFYNPQFMLDYSNGRYSFKYQGCKETVDLDEMADGGTIKYKVNGKKLIMYAKGNDGSSGEVHLFNIESLSGNTLKASLSDEMKEKMRSAYEQGKRIAEQYGIEAPQSIEVALNGVFIMEKQ